MEDTARRYAEGRGASWSDPIERRIGYSLWVHIASHSRIQAQIRIGRPFARPRL